MSVEGRGIGAYGGRWVGCTWEDVGGGAQSGGWVGLVVVEGMEGVGRRGDGVGVGG